MSSDAVYLRRVMHLLFRRAPMPEAYLPRELRGCRLCRQRGEFSIACVQWANVGCTAAAACSCVSGSKKT